MGAHLSSPSSTTEEASSQPSSTSPPETPPANMSSPSSSPKRTVEEQRQTTVQESDKSKKEEKAEEGEEEEEEGQCRFCLFMKGGACKDAFIAWEDCVKVAEDEKDDLVVKCSEAIRVLKLCLDANPDTTSRY
ncbi:hypothetical protein LINPERHAP1_LOCUS34623 [Linum perenne]